MTFSSFNLFSDVASEYINTQKVSEVLSSVAENIPGDNIFGLIPGISLATLSKRQFRECGFIVDTVTNERLAFQYNVNSAESGGAEYEEHLTLARSTPIPQYKNGKARVLTLPIIYTIRSRTRDDVVRNVRWLQSLAYPDYNEEQEIARGPHPVVVIQGKLYTNDVWLVRDFNIVYGKALDPITQLPESATVTLTLFEYRLTGKGKEEFIVL